MLIYMIEKYIAFLFINYNKIIICTQNHKHIKKFCVGSI